MNLSTTAEAKLIHLYKNGSLSASVRFRSGYGGLWRPIPFPEPYHELNMAGLVTCEVRRVRDADERCDQWVWELTDRGRVSAILLGAKEQ